MVYRIRRFLQNNISRLLSTWPDDSSSSLRSGSEHKKLLWKERGSSEFHIPCQLRFLSLLPTRFKIKIAPQSNCNLSSQIKMHICFNVGLSVLYAMRGIWYLHVEVLSCFLWKKPLEQPLYEMLPSCSSHNQYWTSCWWCMPWTIAPSSLLPAWLHIIQLHDKTIQWQWEVLGIASAQGHGLLWSRERVWFITIQNPLTLDTGASHQSFSSLTNHSSSMMNLAKIKIHSSLDFNPCWPVAHHYHLFHTSWWEKQTAHKSQCITMYRLIPFCDSIDLLPLPVKLIDYRTEWCSFHLVPHFAECSPSLWLCELWVHFLEAVWNISLFNCCCFELVVRGITARGTCFELQRHYTTRRCVLCPFWVVFVDPHPCTLSMWWCVFFLDLSSLSMSLMFF